MNTAPKRGMETVVPLRPLNPVGTARPMRTIFYHEMEPNQGVSIQTAGDGLQTLQDCERVLEVVEMIKRWCEEDGTFPALGSKRTKRDLPGQAGTARDGASDAGETRQ